MEQKPTWRNRLLSKWKGDPKPTGETGEENAQRFVAAVVNRAHRERIIQMYPDGKTWDIRCGWFWMVNEAWRARVLELLKNEPVQDARFSAPDDYDGWTFSAYSTVPVPYVAQLKLTDTF